MFMTLLSFSYFRGILLKKRNGLQIVVVLLGLIPVFEIVPKSIKLSFSLFSNPGFLCQFCIPFHFFLYFFCKIGTV